MACAWPLSLGLLIMGPLSYAGSLPAVLQVEAADAAWVAELRAPSQDQLLASFRAGGSWKADPLQGAPALLRMTQLILGHIRRHIQACGEPPCVLWT